MHSRCASATCSDRRNAIAGDAAGSLAKIAEEGAGVLVYLHQTGLGARKHISLRALHGQPHSAAG